MNRKGYTLLEAAIGMLLTAIIASSVFSIALTSKRGSAKGLRKLIANQATHQLGEELKSYVAQQRSSLPTNMNGPASGASTWSLDGGSVDDTSCTNCWALESGTHTLTGYLPGWFEAAPYYGRISYYVWTVQDVDPGKMWVMPGVAITVSWSEI
jgi:hypothetical protein